MVNMNDFKITLQGFLDCFKNNNLSFNITKKNKREDAALASSVIEQTEIQLTKMLQRARVELSKAYKLHKQNKISIDELFDYEWYVHELEQQLKNIKDFDKE